MAEKICFIDFEYTCFEHQKNTPQNVWQRELLSVGAVICEEDETYNCAVRDVFYSIIKPLETTELTRYCVELTGITTQQAMASSDGGRVLESLYSILKKHGCTKLYCWGNRDRQILGYQFYRYGRNAVNENGLRFIYDHLIDLEEQIRSEKMGTQMRMSMRKCVSAMNKTITVPQIGQTESSKPVKMQNVREFVKIPPPKEDDLHNALEDACMLRRVYIEYKRNTSAFRRYISSFVTELFRKGGAENGRTQKNKS